MTNEQALYLRGRLEAVVRRSLRYRGMMVLVLWQVPMQPVVRPNGSIGIMIGGGTDEHAELSCEGDLMRADRMSYRVAAVEADYSSSERVRVDAVLGYMHSDFASHDGAFGAVQVRGDWKSVGFGAGVMVSPSFDPYEPETDVWPSVHGRIGAARGLHLRGDVYPPGAFGAQQMVRLGFGFNAVAREETALFLGVAALGHGEASTGVVGELSVPMGDRFGLRFQGHYAGGHAHPVSGIAAGGRFRLGSAPVAPSSLTRRP